MVDADGATRISDLAKLEAALIRSETAVCVNICSDVPIAN